MRRSVVSSNSNPAASAAFKSAPLLSVSQPFDCAVETVCPDNARASPFGVPWSKRTSTGGDGGAAQTLCDEVEDGGDPRAVVAEVDAVGEEPRLVRLHEADELIAIARKDLTLLVRNRGALFFTFSLVLASSVLSPSGELDSSAIASSAATSAGSVPGGSGGEASSGTVSGPGSI